MRYEKQAVRNDDEWIMSESLERDDNDVTNAVCDNVAAELRRDT